MDTWKVGSFVVSGDRVVDDRILFLHLEAHNRTIDSHVRRRWTYNL